MGYSKHVGRVGALAIALGVGVAVGTMPGVAWATPDSASPADTAPPPPSTPPGGTGTPSIASSAVNPPKDPSPKPDAVVGPQPDGSQVTVTVGGGSAPPVTLSGSGGANTTVGEEPPTGKKEPDPKPSTEPAATTPSKKSDPKPEHKSTDSPELAGKPIADPKPAAAPTVVTKSVVELAALTPTAKKAAEPAVSSADTQPKSAVTDTKVASLAPAPAAEQTGVKVAAQVLSAVLSPLLAPSPNSPAAPALLWAVLAWTRRESAQAATGGSASSALSQTMTSQTIAPIPDPVTATPPTARLAATTTAAPATTTTASLTSTALVAPAPNPLGAVSFVVNSVVNLVGRLLGGLLGGLFNQAPTASPTVNPGVDSVTGAVTGNLNARDPNGDKLTYTVSTPPTKGGATVSTAGVFTYTPNPAARHEAAATPGDDVDQFAVTISDGRGGVTTATVKNLPITPKNALPTTPVVSQVGSPNPATGAVTVKVTVTDIDSDTVTYTAPTPTARNGTVAASATVAGQFTYTPDPTVRHAVAGGAPNTDSLTVTANDGHGGTLVVQVPVTITPKNASPTGTALAGQPDAITGAVTIDVTVADDDHDTLTLSAPVTTAKNGTVAASTTVPGRFTYTPDAAARATALQTHEDDVDTFDITVTDAHTGTATIHVPVTVLPANRVPIVAAPTMGSPSSAGAIAGDLHVTDPDGDTLHYVLDTAPTRGGVVVNPDGTFIYTPRPEERLAASLTTIDEKDAFTVKVTDGKGGQVTATVLNILVAELPTNSIIDTAAVGDGPRDVVFSPDGRYAYVANTGGNSVTVLDTNGYTTVATIPVGSGPLAVAVSADGARLYTANSTSHSVSVINTGTNTVAETISLGTDVEPTGIAVGPNGIVYTTNTNSTVSIINTATAPSSVSTIQVDPRSAVFSADGRGYFLDSSHGTVIVLDTTNNNAPLGTVAVGADPYDIAISPSGSHVYVTNPGDNTVRDIDTANLTAAPAIIHVGDQPRGIDVTPNGQRVYVANFGDDTISIIDTATHAVTSIPVSNGPFAIDINPAGTQATITHTENDTVTVLLLAGDAPPVVAPSVNTPDPTTGLVTGNVNASDADGDSLSYAVGTGPANGTTVINAATGGFTYTPTAAARLAAAATLGAETDTFTVTVDDHRGQTTTTTVNVQIAPAGILGQPTVSGAPNGGVVVSPDGTKAVQVTAAWPNAASERSTVITVIDTRTGLPVGTSVTVPTSQQVGSATFNADGSRVGVVSYLYNPSTNTTTSYITIVNTATGARVGNTVEMVGSGYTGVQFSPDGGRAVVSTVTNPGTTFVAILDAATGNRVAPDMPVDGVTVADGVTFSPNGARAYLTTNTGSQSQVVVIDTVNGVQVGDALSLAGSASGGLQMFASGARALQTVGNGPTTRIYTIDTATNTILGTPIDLTGFATGFPSAHAVLNANGTRAVQATNDGGPNGATRLTVIDTMAGAVIGTPTVLPGQLQFGIIQFSGDGSKVIASTMTGDLFSNNTATNIAVINAASGNQIGGTATLTGPLRRGYLINAANTRAVAILNPTGPGSGVRVAVIDLTNGAVVGSPISLAGFDSGAVISPDGTRLVDTFLDNGDGKTKIAVVNLVDGTSAGVVSLGTSGGIGAPAFAPDGKTVFQTLIVNDPGLQWTQLAAVDVSGAPTLVGTVAIPGASTSGDVRMTLNGTRAVVTTNSGGTPIETYTTTVTIIDTAPFLVDPGL